MATPPISPAEVTRTLAAVKAAGGNVSAAARKLGLPRNTVYSRLGRIAQGDLTEDPVQRRAFTTRLEHAERAARDANKELARLENLRTHVFKLAEVDLAPPKWGTAVPRSFNAPGIPLLFFSDAQWGEVINPREIDGINAYNERIAQERYKLLIDKTIDLASRHMVNPRYPGIYYVRGGDMVSGDIHDELVRTNDLTSLSQVRSLVEAEIAGITRLADVFGRVHVISVPGNHGRQTVKPHAKRYAELNYDTLSAWMIEMWFKGRNDSRVTFSTPYSGDHLFHIYGYLFLATHGDRIGSRGGGGFIGPSITVARGHKKLLDYYARLGKIIDYTLIGHFHTRMELNNMFVNGCLPGASEYGRDNRFEPAAPEQWLLFVHPHHGVTARWPIHLAPKPRLVSAGEAIRS